MLRTSCPDPRVGSGKLWDDLGSTQFVTSRNGAVETGSLAKRNTSRGRIIGSSDDDDEDELDFLSSGSRSEDVEEPSLRKGKGRITKGRIRKAAVQEQEPGYHPGFPPKRKLPDFKKKSKPEEGGVSTSRSKLSDVLQEVSERTKSHKTHPTLPRLSGTSSESSDFNQATPRAKHSKSRIPEKFPTLDPLSISDSTTHKQASRKAVAKAKARPKASSDRVTSLVRGDTVSNTTTPRKHSESSLFPIPSPLSSPAHQHPQSSPSSGRGTKSLDTSDDEADEDAFNRTPKQRPPLRPFPMMAASRLETCIRTPRQKIASAHPGDANAGDLEVFVEDDSRQRLSTNMLIAFILTIFFKFLLANQRTHRCCALSATRSFPLTPPPCIAPFSKPPSARPIRIRARVTLEGLKLRWAYTLPRASVTDLRHIRYLRP